MKTRRYCRSCGRMLGKSCTKGYAFECRNCGEDFYCIETLRWEKDSLTINRLRKDNHKPICDEWWYNTELKIMEKITRYRQSDFDPEDGCQAFVDACDKWWEALSQSEKAEIWKEYK